MEGLLMRKNRRKSLAPFGDTLPESRQRLEAVSKRKPSLDWPDTETVMMRHWEDENRPEWGINQGLTPIEHILFSDEQLVDRTWGCAKAHPPIAERDRQVIAATIQILATGWGRSFYERFLKKFRKA